MTLKDLKCGETALILELRMNPDDTERLETLGFSPGQTVISVRCVGRSGPRIYNLQGQDLAIGADTAAQIVVKPSAMC